MISETTEKKFKKQHNAFVRGLEGRIKQSQDFNFRLSNINSNEYGEDADFEFDKTNVRRSESAADDYLKVCA
jgi:hypothetical protein